MAIQQYIGGVGRRDIVSLLPVWGTLGMTLWAQYCQADTIL